MGKHEKRAKGQTVQNGVDFDRNVIFRGDILTLYRSNLNFDVDDANLFRVRVDFDESGIDRPVELSESADESDATLRDGSAWREALVRLEEKYRSS